MYQIGDFSRITGLTVKSLRFYHEQQVLVPSYVDPDSSYRYYSRTQVDLAVRIRQLRDWEVPVAEIQRLMTQSSDEQIAEYLRRHAGELRARAGHYRGLQRDIERALSDEQESRKMTVLEREICEKTIEPQLIAGVRIRGKYQECGRGFRQIGRRFGRHICGKPFLLHYDTEYKEEDADFEACMPIRRGESTEGVDVRQLSGGRCVSLIHEGPYDDLGSSYARLFDHARGKGYQTAVPCREVYLKGPGMIFRGNPKKYLTEIQLMIQE